MKLGQRVSCALARAMFRVRKSRFSSTNLFSSPRSIVNSFTVVMPVTICHTRLLIFPVDSWMPRNNGMRRGSTVKTNAITATRTAEMMSMSTPFSRKSTGKNSANMLREFGIYMMPGPRSVRTLSRSFVVRDTGHRSHETGREE